MKKLFLIGAFLFSVFAGQSAYSQCCPTAQPCDRPCDQPCNECWCLYVHYEPCYYNTKRCVEEQIPCTRKCCRMVPRYYQVQRCRYVPEYYTETRCCQECEYYQVNDCRTCKRVICEPQCKYVPKYYWKHSCGDVAPMAGCRP